MAPIQTVYIANFLINKADIHSQSFYFKHVITHARTLPRAEQVPVTERKKRIEGTNAGRHRRFIVDNSPSQQGNLGPAMLRRCSRRPRVAAPAALAPYDARRRPRRCSSEHVTSGIGQWRRQPVCSDAPPGR
jgi:hypothetical protein